VPRNLRGMYQIAGQVLKKDSHSAAGISFSNFCCLGMYQAKVIEGWCVQAHWSQLVVFEMNSAEVGRLCNYVCGWNGVGKAQGFTITINPALP